MFKTSHRCVACLPLRYLRLDINCKTSDIEGSNRQGSTSLRFITYMTVITSCDDRYSLTVPTPPSGLTMKRGGQAPPAAVRPDPSGRELPSGRDRSRGEARGVPDPPPR